MFPYVKMLERHEALSIHFQFLIHRVVNLLKILLLYLDETSKGIESRLMAATDTEYDQLRRENISTILSYGDSFMDLVCRDACDGLDVGRVSQLKFSYCGCGKKYKCVFVCCFCFTPTVKSYNHVRMVS